ncbi:hypothetical protein EDD18DRAFT_635754 [Armillaria luteobubalina]|uniref:Uncharacterized protein n=1 Tax=Armillaria luteobubalina TaxID=153913 RepID=A0AA39QK90_9AGAR|nr:hypothetical protein EDD18DRAFT_635754 [Armillaria luteobubalina]
MHLAEALLIHDKGDSSYHRRHTVLTKTYKSKLLIFLRATKDGTLPDASIRSVYNVSTFNRCKPVNPTFMKLGWYDRRVDIIMINNDSTERVADASECHEESHLSLLSLHSHPAANPPPICGTLNPSSNNESSLSKTCKKDKPMQSMEHKHNVQQECCLQLLWCQYISKLLRMSYLCTFKF